MNEEIESERPKVGTGVFVFRDGKFVMTKRINAHGEGTWALAGGHLEFGEAWEECARREVREEFGVEIENVRFLTATNDIFPKDHKHYVTIFLRADLASGEPRIMEPEKASALEWVTLKTLPAPLFVAVKNLLNSGFDPSGIERE